MSEIDVRILTPEREIWSGKARIITAQTISGEVGIMRGHIPLFAALAPSSAVSITTSAGERKVAAVVEGFLSVTPQHVILLTQYCTWVTSNTTVDEITITQVAENSDSIDADIFRSATIKAISVLNR